MNPLPPFCLVPASLRASPAAAATRLPRSANESAGSGRASASDWSVGALVVATIDMILQLMGGRQAGTEGNLLVKLCASCNTLQGERGQKYAL